MELDTQTDYRCRVCLNITKQALVLQESISGSVEALSYMDVLTLCCNIKISLDDGKPNKICLVCMENARISYKFKVCCERSNLILENENQTSSRCNSLEDVKYDDAYDSFGDDSFKNDIIALNPVSINKHEIELTNLDENMTSDLVEPSILKLVEENIQTNIPEDTSKHNNNTFNSKHKCNTCCTKFKSFATLSVHILKKHTAAVGKCCYCDTNLVDYASLITHMKEDHSDILCKHILCDICGAVFMIPSQLHRHTQKLHKTLYECKHCDFTSMYSEDFQGHMRKEHTVIEMAEGKDFSKCEGIKKCEYCNYTTVSKFKFGKHMQLEHEDKKGFLCNKCGAKFFKKHRLKIHVYNQHRTGDDNKNCICEVCGTQFTLLENLKQHMKIHIGVRSYKCKFCPKAFVQSTSLNIHIKTHNEERNVKCDVCGKCFKTKNNLRSHFERIHIRELKVTCSVCDKTFLNKKDLNVHNVVHTRSRLFKCEVCKRGFGRRDQLKTHMRTHTGEKPHVCHVCKKGFSQAHCLRTHLLKHSNTENKNVST